jgi:hypothetical protein
MRSRYYLPVLLFAGWTCLSAPAAENAAETEARLRNDVAILAADALEGRGVGTEGLNQAADYLARRFAEIGLRTDLYDGSPFQTFEITVAAEMGPRERNRLTLVSPSGRRDLALGETFTPLATGGSAAFHAPLVFAGYGITAKSLKRGEETFDYDDYARIDARGKVVILLRKEPQQKDEKSPFNGTKTTLHALYSQKLKNALDHGAVAVIVVNDAQELAGRREQDTKLLKAALDALAGYRDRLAAAAPGTADFANAAAGVAKSAAEAAELGKSLSASADVLLPFNGAGDMSTQRKLPVLFCTRGAIDPVIQAALGKDLATLEREIDSDLVPRSADLAGWQAEGESEVLEKKAQIKNVIGVLEGEGPLADETIVIGAHYDHLGRGGAGSLAPWTVEIHNGADDNGSGTATLLEVARRLTQAPQKPRRRIVFIAFTGEERGLLGSAHYCRQPRFPLEKTVAMFNLDMVGRLKDDKLIVYGTGTAREFDSLVERLSQQLGFKLTKHPGGFGPSDHSSFYSRQIPVLHLFTGTHSDYHRPSDDTEKLNFAGMRRVADWLLEAVLATDAADQRPTYVENKKYEQIADSSAAGDPVAGERPSFGSMPAYPNPVKDGVLLEAVMEGSAAERAGIKAGDILIQLGDAKITDLDAFQAALTSHKPGDKVKAVVRRGEKTVEAEVTLGRRRGP